MSKFEQLRGELVAGLTSEELEANARARLLIDLGDAEEKAWDLLSRYKFQMFGYWAAIWVHLNRIGKFGLPNPFRATVKVAREEQRRWEAPAR